MHKLTVGQLYLAGRRSWPEAAEFNFRGGAFELRLFLPGLRADEIQDLRQGRTEFALVVEGDVILLLYRFGGSIPWSDAPYTIHLVSEADRRPPMALATEQSRDVLQVVVVEATTGIVQALRLVSFSPAFSRALRGAIAAQLARPWPGRTEYDRQVDEIYRRYPVQSDMLKIARARCAGGED